MQLHQQRAERVNLKHLLARLEDEHDPIDVAERAEIMRLWRTARQDPSRTVLNADRSLRLITSGWAGWLRYNEFGNRLIFLFLMPGDFIIPGLFELECCDLMALTPVRTVDASALLEQEATLTPRSARLIRQSGKNYRLLLLDHLTRLTGGDTAQAVAHMLYEFYARALASGACLEHRFPFPIGQRVISCALGRSSVQVNKVISAFQAEGLLEVGYDWVRVRDPERFQLRAGLTHSLIRPSRPQAKLSLSYA